MRCAAKRDANEKPIMQALQLAGWSVFPISAPGFPDLFCVRNGAVRLVEVKQPKGKLTEAQVALHQRLKAAGLTVHVVRDVQEALTAVGVVQRRGLREGYTVKPSLKLPSNSVCVACADGVHELAGQGPCACLCHETQGVRT